MLTKIKTDIIPLKQHFVKVQGKPVLDKKAICAFVATGFFLDNDTYWDNLKVLRPGTINEIDAHGNLVSSKQWFNWYYKPRAILFDQAVEEFTQLFDDINASELDGRQIILPLSGGLDSRSQAASLLPQSNKVHAFSYSFSGGYKESEIARKVAKNAKFTFDAFKIESGYLWQKLDFAAQTNKCYAEFTHCTQLCVLDQFDDMGEIFSLGHWGDVLFDRMIRINSSSIDLLQILKKKIVKPMGFALATDLWKMWNIEGDFETYFNERLKTMLDAIEIDNPDAKLRAFKSMYWAPRWTSVNLAFYEKKHPISLPYYNNKICEFICTIPEDYLADRKIQIAYIKNKSPQIAGITWLDKRPFNLYNYHLSKAPFNWPYKIKNRLQRDINALLGSQYIQRNWELQFLGDDNSEQLKSYLSNSNLSDIVENDIVDKYVRLFNQGNQKHTSHSLSMLLTLAAFSNHYLNNFELHSNNS